MKKKILVLCIIICVFVVTACGSGETQGDLQNNEKDSQDDSAFQLNEGPAPTQDQKELTFDEANVLSFELLNRDDESFKEIIATFNVKNESDNPVDYCSINFIYLDKDGNEICKDGRFTDFQIKSGKKSIVKSYSHLNDGDKSNISNIDVASYSYTVGDKSYDVNLQLEEVNSWDNSNESSVDFDSVNIVKFTPNGKGINSIGAYEVEVQIENIGQIPIAKVTYKMGYFDSEENLLSQDGRFSDSVLNPGNFVMSNSYNTDKNTSVQTTAFGIYQYDYTLADVDNNGFNHYEINLMTNKASGSMVE